MPKRFLSENQLCFSVEGRPVAKGNLSGSGCYGKMQYKQLVRLGAKTAIAEQGWELTDGGIYIVIVVYVDAGGQTTSKALKKKRLKNDIMLAVREPRITLIAKYVVDALKGVVFKTVKQIVGMTVVKKYSAEPRIEVLIGKPKDYKELSHDLRNA